MSDTDLNVQRAPFKLALLAFIGIAAVGLGVAIWLATFDQTLTDQQERLALTSDWMLKLGIGAIIGQGVDRRIR